VTHIGLAKVPLLSAASLLLGGCGFFGMEHTCYPDYGLEAGFHMFVPSLDTTASEPVVLPMRRDRNHLNIRFYEGVGKERAEAILREYGFINRAPQSFNHPLEVGNLVRVSRHPAEDYYTTYGDTTLSRLGNTAEVEYVLPAFFLDEVKDPPGVQAPSVRVIFKEEVPLERQQVWIDSVKQVNRLEKYQVIEGYDPPPPKYYLRVTKNSTDDPYTLVERWLNDPMLRPSWDLGFILNGLPPLECP
jgi:hypothetical protein